MLNIPSDILDMFFPSLEENSGKKKTKKLDKRIYQIIKSN